ncbi:replication initiation protein [Pseudobacillus badius]|uniref:replication initiation protein n=1 Tax=Bacillus badius TaxID=1455 RepID=UPI003D33939F
MDHPRDEQLSLEIEDADIRPYYWINQSNELINARQDLSINERRIVYALVSLVQPDDKDFKMYSLPIKELANLIGVSEKSFYERVEKAVDGLQSKMFVIETYDSTKGQVIVNKINWIQQATYLKGEGIVRIKLSDALADYLVNLKTYTKYQLFNVLQFKSEYSWRIYELLKERQPWGKRIIKVNELRRLLNIADDKLTLMKNFRNVVLDKAKNEINAKTDIHFEYDVHKRKGRKIESFIFYIHRNESNIDKYLTEEAVDYDVKTLLNRLIANGVKRKKAEEFIGKYHPRYIEENILYVMRSTGDSIANLAGYIVKAVENNYAESIYEANKKEQSLYSIVQKDYSNRLNIKAKEDVKALEAINSYYMTVIQKEKPSSLELVREIGKEREKVLFKKLNDIQLERQNMNYPPLTLDDIEESPIKPFFEQWQKMNELPY